MLLGRRRGFAVPPKLAKIRFAQLDLPRYRRVTARIGLRVLGSGRREGLLSARSKRGLSAKKPENARILRQRIIFIIVLPHAVCQELFVSKRGAAFACVKRKNMVL